MSSINSTELHAEDSLHSQKDVSLPLSDLTHPQEHVDLELSPAMISDWMQTALSIAENPERTEDDHEMMLKICWEALNFCGYPTIEAVAKPRPNEFCGTISEELRQPVADALWVIGVQQLGQDDHLLARSVQFLQRAAMLDPESTNVVLDYADITLQLRPDHFMMMRDREMRIQTILGHCSTASDYVNHLLLNRFKIDFTCKLEVSFQGWDQGSKHALWETLEFKMLLGRAIGEGRSAKGPLLGSIDAAGLRLALCGFARNFVTALQQINRAIDQKQRGRDSFPVDTMQSVREILAWAGETYATLDRLSRNRPNADIRTFIEHTMDRLDRAIDNC